MDTVHLLNGCAMTHQTGRWGKLDGLVAAALALKSSWNAIGRAAVILHYGQFWEFCPKILPLSLVLIVSIFALFQKF